MPPDFATQLSACVCVSLPVCVCVYFLYLEKNSFDISALYRACAASYIKNYYDDFMRSKCRLIIKQKAQKQSKIQKEGKKKPKKENKYTRKKKK